MPADKIQIENHSIFFLQIHVTWVPCHHGVERSQVADGRDGLQACRAATNILVLIPVW
jgi:hypothetical protein